MTELENECKAKELAIFKVQDQIQQIRKVGMNQQRAMTDLNKDEEFQTKLRQVNDEVRRVKHSLKETQDRQKELDRVNQEQHLVLLAMEERSRKLQTLIQ